MKRIFLLTLTICMGIFILLNIYYLGNKEEAKINNTDAIKTSSTPEIKAMTLVAAGDCLMHNTQIWSGLQPDGSYCFERFFVDVKEYINDGDYSLINLETPLAGPNSGYTGYPLFNSPDAIADTLEKAGFDLIVTANNHAMDRGYTGTVRTLEVLHNAGLDTVGTYKSDEESRTFLIRDINGIKTGFIAYSYGTNGLPVPQEHPYLFNFLEKDKVLADIAALRPEVDVLVLILHWGVEYTPKPTTEQTETAYEFFEAGADVILGSHPHVIQDMEIIRIKDKDRFVVYSMGNFISHQIGQKRNSGVLLKIKFVQEVLNGDTVLDSISYIPTYSHHYYENGKMHFRVVPVKDTIQKIENGEEPYLVYEDIPVLQSVLDHTSNQLGEPFTGSNQTTL